MIFVAAVAAQPVLASDPPATTPIASYVQAPGGNGTRTLYYKNEDKIVTQPIASLTLPGAHAGTPTRTTITPKSELFTTSDESATTPGAVAVQAMLDVKTGPFAAIFATPQNAFFSFSAVSTHAPVLSDGLFTQIFDSGSLTFTLTSPLYRLDSFGNPVGPGLTNLLTINFTNAVLSGSENGLTMGFSASTPDSTITYTSDFRQFTSDDLQTAFDFSISGADLSVPLSRAPVDPALTRVTGVRSLNDFRASTTGTFAASGFPEPGSWAMVLVGFGAIGLARRRGRDRLWA